MRATRVPVHLKDGRNLKNLLMSPKDKNKITQKSVVIYWFKCDRKDGEDDYIRQSSRTFGERFKEYSKSKALPLIYEHQKNTYHTTFVESFTIMRRQGQTIAIAIKEVIYMRVNNPTINRNIGKFNLTHMYRIMFWVPYQNL